MVNQVKELLVVEDDFSIRELLAAAFEELPDCRVSQVSTVKEALTVLDHKPVDLITLDLLLSGVDGNTLLQELAARQATTPVVIISASVQKASTTAYPYVKALVSKPFDLDELIGIIQANLVESFDRIERGPKRVKQSQDKIKDSLDKLQSAQDFLQPPTSE